MEKRKHKRKTLAQNFLKDPELVRRLVRIAGIGASDTVYEIGPGKGIITAELARVARKVIAIEKDPRLVGALRHEFRGRSNVEIVGKDFLGYAIRTTDPYKIFANIPYNVTAEIVRKVVHSKPAPVEVFLTMQKEPARKFSGVPNETLFSLLAKPYWEFRILHRFRRTDFYPVPDVDSVLLRIHRRDRPLLSREDALLYRDFVRFGFGGWKRHLRSAFKDVFTYTQWKRLSHDLRFHLNATPTRLTFEQWLRLYHGYKYLKVDAKHKASENEA